MLLHTIRATSAARFSWPGSYRYTYIMADGTIICSDCVRENLNLIIADTRDGSNDEWTVVAVDTTETIEDPTTCDNCGRQLCPYTD